MVHHEDCVWGKEFFDTYMRHARRMSYNNEELHRAAALSLIGQAIRNVRLESDQSFIDGRIHPFIIQSSGTGKNSAFNFMSNVAEAAGYDFQSHGKDSTAGIMGTVKRNGDQKKGDLAGSGFVAWKEAQQLLKAAKQDHSNDITEVINQALDPSGNISRALSGGKLEYNSRTSLFATTYPPEPDGQVDLISQGFFPRTLFIYRKLPENFYDNVNKRRDDNLPREGESSRSKFKKMEKDIEKLGNTLNYINDQVWQHGTVYSEEDVHWAQGKNHIEYFEGLEEDVSINPTPIVEEALEDYTYRVRSLTKEFRTRLFDIIYKISAALAAVDRDEQKEIYVSRVIRERHVHHAKKIVQDSLESIFNFVRDYMVEVGDKQLNQVERAVRRICRNDSGHATVREVMVETSRRKREVRDDIATLEEMGKVESVDKPAQSLEAGDRVKLNLDFDPYSR